MSERLPHALLKPLGANTFLERSLAQLKGRAGLGQFALVDELREQHLDRANGLMNSARVAAKLHAPGMQRILGGRKLEAGAWVAMEVVPGVVLADVVKSIKKAGWPGMPLAHAAAVVVGAATALSKLHDAERSHGGLTPGRLSLSWRGETKVCDLLHAWVGVAPDVPGFTPPEGLPSPAADVYALAHIFAQLIGGLEAAPPPVRAVMQRAMEAAASARYSTGALFAEALRQAVPELTASAKLGQWLRGVCADRFERWKTVLRGIKSERPLGEVSRLAELVPRLRPSALVSMPPVQGVIPNLAEMRNVSGPPGPAGRSAPPGEAPPVPESSADRGGMSWPPGPGLDESRSISWPPEPVAAESGLSDREQPLPVDALQVDDERTVEAKVPAVAEPVLAPVMAVAAPVVAPVVPVAAPVVPEVVAPSAPEPVVPAPRPIHRPASVLGTGPIRGVPQDGYEPVLWDDSADAVEAQFRPLTGVGRDSIRAVVGIEGSGQATGDPNAVPVAEITQLVGGRVVGSWLLHAGERFPRRGAALLSMSRAGAKLAPPAEATGIYHHLGKAEPLTGATVRLELGDRAQVDQGELSFRIRIDHAARVAGKATGERVPWVVYLLCLLLAAGTQLSLGIAGVVGLESIGVEMTVDSEPTPERFALLKEDLPLPELKKKLEKVKPKKKKKPKVRLKKRKIAKKTPPKPEPPSEKPPQLQPRVRNKIRSKIAGRARGKTAAQQALEALRTPNAGKGETLEDVVTNFDAVGAKGSSNVMNVVSDLGGLPGGKINVGRNKGGGEIGTLGGKEAGGKGVGKLGTGRARKRKGTRGKVKTVRAFTKVSGCQISKSLIRAAMERRIGRIQGCYEKALARGKVGGGKVTVEWTIAANGTAKNVRISVSTLSNAKVKSCILRVVRKTKFPKPTGGQCKIKYPFLFSEVQ